MELHVEVFMALKFAWCLYPSDGLRVNQYKRTRGVHDHGDAEAMRTRGVHDHGDAEALNINRTA